MVRHVHPALAAALASLLGIATLGLVNCGGDDSSGLISSPTPAATVTPDASESGPILTAIAPAIGNVTGGTAVTLTGGGFTGASAVTFGGAAATSFHVDSDSQISGVSPAGSVGSVPVVVTTSFGNSNDLDFTYGAAPTLASATPSHAPINTAGVAVALTGTHLTGATSVTLGGVNVVSFSVASDTQVSVVLPSVSSAGMQALHAVTPLGTSNDLPFTFGNSPALTSINPTFGPPGGGTSVILTGTGFTGASAVSFGTVAAPSFTVTSDTQIKAVSPAGAGSVNVTVTTPYGASNGIGFAYGSSPTLSSLTPNLGLTSGNTQVVIAGAHLTGATSVSFGATAATAFTVDSDTQVTALSPAGTGSVNVVVTTVNGASNGLAFTYGVPPTISALAPSVVPAAGGTTVTITGTGFTGATGLLVAGVSTVFMTASDTSASFVTAAHAAAPVTVAFTSSFGNSNAATLTYGPAPTITGISPVTGPTSGNTTVVLTGTGFTGATAVAFGATAATAFTVNSGTQITATSPAGPAGAVSVKVTTFLGTSNGVTYTYSPCGVGVAGTTLTICETGGDCSQPYFGPLLKAIPVTGITDTQISSNNSHGPTCKSVCNAAGTQCTTGVVAH